MEDSNANWGDWLDSGFNTEDCSRLRTQFRNLKSDKIVPSIGIWPEIHLEPPTTLPHKKGLGSFSTLTGCEEDPGCHGAFPGCLFLFLSIPWIGNFFPGLQAEVRSLRLEVRFWIWWRESSLVECLLTASASTQSPMISSSGQNWPLVVPNVCSTTRPASGLQGSLTSRHFLPMDSVTYAIQDCNKNHVCHISSGPCLKLKNVRFKRTTSWARRPMDGFTRFPPPPNGIMYIGS